MATIGEITGMRPPKRYCDGKHPHKSEGAADAHVRALQRKGSVKDAHLLRSYRCGNCGFWHTGRTRAPQPEPTPNMPHTHGRVKFRKPEVE